MVRRSIKDRAFDALYNMKFDNERSAHRADVVERVVIKGADRVGRWSDTAKARAQQTVKTKVHDRLFGKKKPQKKKKSFLGI